MKKSFFSWDFVLPGKYIEDEIRSLVSQHPKEQQDEAIEYAMKNLEQMLYKTANTPVQNPISYLAALMLHEKRMEGSTIKNLEKELNLSDNSIKSQIQKITEEWITPEFRKKAEEIRTLCYFAGVYNAKELKKFLDWKPRKTQEYLNYLKNKYSDFEKLYKYDLHILRQEKASETLKKRNFRRPEDKKKRQDDLLSLAESLPPGTLTLEKIEKKFNIKTSTVQRDLTDLRRQGHDIELRGMTDGIIWEKVKQRIEKLKDIFEVTGYLSYRRLSDVLPYTYSEVRQAIDRSKFVYPKFYNRFKEEQKEKKGKHSNEYRDFLKSIPKELEKEEITPGEYWFALQAVKNCWKIKIETDLLKAVNKYSNITPKELHDYMFTPSKITYLCP
ncbi:MAG: HTH domain-containing protein [Candidatus Aenigmarchaeota archaeon]|nr:HTH domain-containing protein [Candidatus Aenigmarchaeota archaeon]